MTLLTAKASQSWHPTAHCARPRVVLVGAGRWGERHLRAWKALEARGECRLVGVIGRNPRRLEQIATCYEVVTSTGMELLGEACAVDIVTGTPAHGPLLLRCIDLGKHVLVEKPMTATLAQAERVRDACRGYPGIVMVGHLFRYNAAADWAMARVSAGDIGRIRFMRGRFTGFRFPERDCGILATSAMHFMYLSDFFIGEHPVKVRAETHNLLGHDLDDACQITLTYPSSAFCWVESDYFTPGKWRTFDIMGELGSIRCDLLEQRGMLCGSRHVIDAEAGSVRAVTGEMIEFSPAEKKEPLVAELEHFVSCIRTGAPPRTGVGDAVAVLATIEKCYQSAATGQEIICE
ncbi:MAG TPA: Gfo/Idh/MocA family oxidoreductase [Streptosporangiaceae bacterium]|jgi:predicted dehydrogenase